MKAWLGSNVAKQEQERPISKKALPSKALNGHALSSAHQESDATLEEEGEIEPLVKVCEYEQITKSRENVLASLATTRDSSVVVRESQLLLDDVVNVWFETPEYIAKKKKDAMVRDMMVRSASERAEGVGHPRALLSYRDMLDDSLSLEACNQVVHGASWSRKLDLRKNKLKLRAINVAVSLRGSAERHAIDT
jgi:hypothetical protein